MIKTKNDLDSRLISEIQADGTPIREYVYLQNEPLAVREYQKSPGLYFFLNDHLGTPQKLIDTAGAVVWAAAYLPYGEAQVQPNNTITNNLRFPGQYYDEETDLHYNWNRYYDPVLGRYLSPDPIGLEGGLNLYGYVQNNPINYIDLNGLCRKEGESAIECSNRIAKEVLGEELAVIDDLGYWGAGALTFAAANSLFTSVTDKAASNAIKNAQIIGAMTEGNIAQKILASNNANEAAIRVATGRTTLSAISKASGVFGMAATGFSFVTRGFGYYFGDCSEKCNKCD